jgi:glycosyltransferase involved in cell wall biosynthesis
MEGVGWHSSISKVVIVAPYCPDDERQKLCKFLKNKLRVRKVVFIGHPLPHRVIQISLLCIWEGEECRKKIIHRRGHKGFLSWIVDVFITLYFILKLRCLFDMYIGSGTWFQTIIGLFLRRLGIVKKVVFWTTDYSISRYRNPALNRIYLKFDEICARQADYVWNPTPRVIEARLKSGYKIDKNRQIIVPYGIELSDIESLHVEELLPDSIVYVGAIRKHGFELLIDALPEVIRKRPRVKVTVINYETFPAELKKRISDQQLEDYFEILGYIHDGKKLERIIQKRKVGVALYPPGFKMYNDPARPKTFLAKGLPVIITNVTSIAEDIKEEKAGIVIKYDKKELSKAILKLLEDEHFFKECRQNAIKLASRYNIETIFVNAFQKMGMKL